MKKKWIYIAVAALTVGGAVATATAHRGMQEPRMPRAIMGQLDLSDEQKAQLKELRADQHKAMKELRASDERPEREEMRALFSAHREKMEQVLTPEQREKMEAIRGEWAMGERPNRGKRGKWGRRGGDHHKGGKDGHMMGRGQRGKKGHALAMLDLSDEQKEKVQELREKQRQEIEALTKKHRAAVEKVLTKEQRKKLEEMKDDAFYGRGRGPRK